KVIEQRDGQLLSLAVFLRFAVIGYDVFDAIQLTDFTHRDLSLRRFAFGFFGVGIRGPYRFDELAARMIPAPDAREFVLAADAGIARVAIRLQDAFKVGKQALGNRPGTRGIILKQDRGLPRWATAGDPHPFVALGAAAILLQHLNAGFIGVEVTTTVLGFTNQVEQGLEHIFQSNHPLGNVGSTDSVATTVLDAFQSI